MNPKEQNCPCGAATSYVDHCGRIHERGAGLGVTAESLMRARYSAYVLGRDEFLLESWHPETRPASLHFDPQTQWMGLEVVHTEQGGGLDTAGIVEFKARFRRGDEHLELHETSAFVRADGRWVYVGPRE